MVTIVSMIEKYWGKKSSSEHLKTVSHPILASFSLDIAAYAYAAYAYPHM